jgi:AcrR family transcriptional regulator
VTERVGSTGAVPGPDGRRSGTLPAPPGRALGARGARTRQRLLEAAEEVFTELGYHDASITKIAEAAGVAPGTFYLYFASKLAIFDELIEDMNHRVRQAMAEAASHGKTRAEAERLGFRAFFHFTAEHPALYRLIRQAEFVSPPSLRLHYERIVGGYAEGLAEAMESGEIAQGDPEVMAWALMGVGEIIGLRWILWEPGAQQLPDEVFDEVFAFVRRALGAR